MAITYYEDTRTFYLDGKNITYAFFINKYGYAEHLYYGKTIGHDDLTFVRGTGGVSTAALIPGTVRDKSCGFQMDSYQFFMPELSFYGTGDYREPAVEVEFPRGDRVTELLYVGHEILKSKPQCKSMPSMRGEETLVIHLKDRIKGFACDLFYSVYEDAGVITRRAVYKNQSSDKVKLHRAYTFSFMLPDMDYEMISLYGAWAKERRIERVPVHHGVASIDSKRVTSSATLNPFMALAKKGSTESTGDVYGFSLIYSSSFVLKAEGVSDGRTLITGGINDFDFSWNLAVGEEFETPEIVMAYSDEGLGGMSRCFHDAYRIYLINPNFVDKKRPIVINNWEGTYFNFDTEKLKRIAKGVAGTGVDTFVLDDGWFGKRNDDYSGLGDWYVNEEKIPGGLTEIINYVNGLGMKFGLWFEPEMINEDSDLYRQHPDYAIGLPDRPRCSSRQQFVLDLTREDVRDTIVEAVNKILKENHIEYVKWDYNRNVTEVFSFQQDPEKQSGFAHRYVLGFYDLCERIVAANPHVFFEGCAGGGARFDPAVLYYFPQIWTSDDTDAEERTMIQYGTSVVYPLSSMSCHISAVPNHQTGRTAPMETRADIAHLGATGYELDSSNFSDADREKIKQQIHDYHEMESLVLRGDLYRTEDPMNSNYFGFMLVSKDKTQALLTAYRRMGSVNNEIKYLKIEGLDPEKNYEVRELKKCFKGKTLMHVGICVSGETMFEQGDFRTLKFHFDEVM